MSGRFLLMMTLLICMSCGVQENKVYNDYVNNYNQLPDNEASKLLKKAINYCGGWEAYTKIAGIDYNKTLLKMDSTGQVLDTITQHHKYNVFPSFAVNMKWSEKDGQDVYEIRNNGQQSWKLKHGKLMTDRRSINSAYNSSHGSQYVVFMPWKLADPKVILEYVGLEQLPNGRAGLGLKVNYTEGSSTTTDHTWWYYFDKDTGAQIATFLKHATGYSYTEFEEYTKVDGMTFHSRRNAYRSDANKENLVLGTIYINENIKLTSSFPDDLFNYNDE